MPKNTHEQILRFYILVKQGRVCRAAFYRAAYNESHAHAETSSPAVQVLYPYL
jgi:hypothetical protein